MPSPPSLITVDWPSLPTYQIIIKSFRRFQCLRTLIDSIHRFYPDAPIIVADDSFEHPETELPEIARELRDRPLVDWIQLPFNRGLPAGRNLAVAHATADVIIMCDDDFVFTPETRIEALLSVLSHRRDIDLIAGCVRFDAVRCFNWSAQLTVVAGEPLRALPLASQWEHTQGVRHRQTELALNWYAARRSVLLASPWDDQFKIVMEHIDHFLTMRRDGVRIHYTPDCIIGHEPRQPETYGEFRMQNIDDYVAQFLQKWNVSSKLGFAMHVEPGVPPVIPDQNRSVLVFGVGHSGTTILTQMLRQLGFSAHNADAEFCEHGYIRDINESIVRGRQFDVDAARRELAYLEQAGSPWVLKDPRFVHTLDHWLPLFANYRPTMIFIERDEDDVARSFRRRNEAPQDGPVITRGVELRQAQQLAREHFNRWPWGKVRIRYEDLASAVSLFRQPESRDK